MVQFEMMTTEETFRKPTIFKYLDYRQYLSDVMDHLGQVDPKYSQRWFTNKAGWKSPQLLTMILKGQRKLSRDLAESLALALKLDEKESEYLFILLDLESAQNKEAQLEILDRIQFQFHNGLFKDLPANGFDYLKKWYYSATRELANISQFEVTPQNIAMALDLSVTEAEEALQFLEQNGYLIKNQNHYVRNEVSLKAADYMSPLIMLQYHLQILDRAFLATKLSREIRHFESLMISMPSKHFELIREKIKQLIREIDMLCENSKRHDDVFQLSIQFYSITGGRLRKDLP